jgi:hypothetical protein
MDTPIPTDKRPVGFWLKLIDGLIDTTVATVLGDHNLTRRHWQTLTTLQRGPATVTDVNVALAPFLTDHETSVRPVIADLIERGWVATHGEHACLTNEGITAQADLHRLVSQSIRTRISDGIAPDEFRAALDVLRRMALNLGWQESTPS